MNQKNLNKMNPNKIIDVKNISKQEKESLEKRIKNLKNEFNISPTLATILIGADSGSLCYLKMQKKNLTKVKCDVLEFKFSSDTTDREVISLIKDLNSDENIHGIMLLKPLPEKLDDENITKSISPKKDIDGITPYNIGALTSYNDGIVPNTVGSVCKILESLPVNLKGKEAVIIGRSDLIGKPLAQKLLFEDMTVTMAHSKTRNLQEVCKRADLLISAVGRGNFIDENYIKDGAILIDVGTSMVDGHLTGDFDFDKVIDKSSFITKVPGGVGTLTTTMLIGNLVLAAENQEYNNI